MIIFLYGPDTYRSRQKLNEIIEHYKKTSKSGLNLKYFDFKKDSYQEFKGEFQIISMFQEKKLMVLKNAFSNSEFKRKFLENSKKFRDSKPSTRAELGAGPVLHRNEVSGAGDIILFYEEGEFSKNDALFNFLKGQAKFQEFKLLGSQRLKNWVKKEFEKYQCQVSDRALGKLIEFIGNDLWQISNEIRKLVCYRAPRVARRRDKSLLNLRSASPRSVSEGGKENEVLFDYKKKQEIGEEDVELLVRPKIETDIFKTIDAISSGNKKQALLLIHKHLEKGDSPLYLLSMINFQFRNLLLVKSCESKTELYVNDMRILSEKLKLHPYVIRKSIQQAKRFTIDELKKIYQKIFQADLNIKTGKIDPQTALDLLITEI
ncbi:MAG: DNA polymerase III subunit delta [Candidatus Nealsonbacteria bacterium]